MKANELRIGNLIQYKIEDLLDVRKVFNEVNVVDSMDISYISDCEKLNSEHTYSPIPINKEWLVNLGFKRIEQDDKGNELCNTLYSISHKGNLGTIDLDLWQWDSWQFDNCSYSIKYVHQLQNLYFALTGEELTLAQ